MTVKELRERYSFEELKTALSPDNLFDKHMDIADALKNFIEKTINNKNDDPFWDLTKRFYS